MVSKRNSFYRFSRMFYLYINLIFLRPQPSIFSYLVYSFCSIFCNGWDGWPPKVRMEFECYVAILFYQCRFLIAFFNLLFLGQYQKSSRFQMEWLDSVSFPLDLLTELYQSLLFLFNNPCKLFSLLLVIGRGGEQISRLQQESGCKIQIAPGKCYWWCFFFNFLETPLHICPINQINLCYRQRRIARQVGHINGSTWVNPVSNPILLLNSIPCSFGHPGWNS